MEKDMDLHEHTEALAKEAYYHELEREENIVRSLPIFGTSLGVFVGALGYLLIGQTKAIRAPQPWRVPVQGVPGARSNEEHYDFES
jgi:hypothetical protein